MHHIQTHKYALNTAYAYMNPYKNKMGKAIVRLLVLSIIFHFIVFPIELFIQSLSHLLSLSLSLSVSYSN